MLYTKYVKNEQVATTLDTTLTNEERGVVLTFLVETLAGLQASNLQAVEENESFYYDADAAEVLSNYTALTSNIIYCDNEAVAYNFSKSEAYTALMSYDTEYRDTVYENMLEFCEENNANTLAQKLFNNK